MVRRPVTAIDDICGVQLQQLLLYLLPLLFLGLLLLLLLLLLRSALLVSALVLVLHENIEACCARWRHGKHKVRLRRAQVCGSDSRSAMQLEICTVYRGTDI